MFWSPTAFEARHAHRIAREEIFGPVATFVRFADEAEAVALANASEYGLAASVWSTNLGRANRVARAIRSGSVVINTPYALFPGVPFGGYKQSGYGRELGNGDDAPLYGDQELAHVYRRKADGSVQGIVFQHMDEPLKIGTDIQHDVRDALERWNVLSTRHRSHGRRLASRSRLLRPLPLFGSMGNRWKRGKIGARSNFWPNGDRSSHRAVHSRPQCFQKRATSSRKRRMVVISICTTTTRRNARTETIERAGFPGKSGLRP